MNTGGEDQFFDLDAPHLPDLNWNPTDHQINEICDLNTEKIVESTANDAGVPDNGTSSTDDGLILKDPPDITEILTLQSQIPATPHNVSVLNAACQKVLREMEQMLINQLQKNRQEQEIVLGYLSTSKKGKNLEGGKKINIKCLGIPYFKDTEGYPPPQNKDVISKLKSHKLLPVHFISGSHIWSPRDSNLLVKGVTEGIDSNKPIDPAKVDWLKVSATHLDGKYSPMECKSMWVMNLSPNVNKSPWSKEEIKSLTNLADKHKHQNWDLIAEELGTNRTGFQCCVKYQTNKPSSGERWTKNEDKRLLEIIKQYRVKDHIPWKKVVWNFEKKSLRQCQERYSYHLRDIKKGAFTMKEDYVLVYLYSKLKSFKEVAKYFPKRVSTQIRSRYNYLVRLTMPEFSQEEDKLLVELMGKYPRNWAKISEHFEDRTKLQCRSRWTVLQKKLRVPIDETIVETETSRNEQSSSGSSRNTRAKDDMDSAIIDSKIAFLSANGKQTCERKFSDGYLKLLDYCRFGYKFLFGPKGRLPSHADDKNGLCTKLKITMKNLFVDPCATLPRFDVGSLVNNCEFDCEDLAVLERLKKSEDGGRIDVDHRLLPPNYMTLVGLRTLLLARGSIINSSVNHVPSERVAETNSDGRLLFSDAKKLFKSRMKSLFAFPLIMSNISQTGVEVRHAPAKKVKRCKPLSQRKRRLHAKRIQAFKRKIQTDLDKKLEKNGLGDLTGSIPNASETDANGTDGTVEPERVVAEEESVKRKRGRPSKIRDKPAERPDEAKKRKVDEDEPARTFRRK